MNNASLAKQKQINLRMQNHQAGRRHRIIFWIFFIVLAIGFFYVIRQPAFRIQSVSVNGSGLVEPKDVKEYVSKKITGYKYFLIPRDSLVFLKKQNLINDIFQEFPRLSSITVQKGKKLNIVISEPIFKNLYCTLDPDSGFPGGCVLMHENGKAGSIAPRYSYAPLFSFYSSGINPILGTVVVHPNEIIRVRTLEAEVVSYGMPVYGYIYGQGYDEILLDTGESFLLLPRIRILSGTKPEEIKKTLGVAVEDIAVKKLLLERLDELEYVDLRFDGQVVYKRR